MLGSISGLWRSRIGYVDFFLELNQKKKGGGRKYAPDKNYQLTIILFFKIKVISMILVYPIDFALLKHLHL